MATSFDFPTRRAPGARVRIGVLGGGPAGLYFALLMKRQDAAHDVLVVEKDPADATYGWGVVFSERALHFMEAGDPASFADIAARLELRPEQHVVHRDGTIVLRGTRFSGIGRLELLQILQRHCERLGVRLVFERRVEDLTPFAGRDLVVAADGVNSIIRKLYAAELGATAELRANRYAWYGTPQPIDALSLIFRENADGVFVAHAYRYSADRSTFIVECDPATWERAGFARMSDAETRAYCERIFVRDLGGQPLLSNRSMWIEFNAVRTRRWWHGNVVLIGDALATAHFSIGSGTRKALEDAIVLAGALGAHPQDVRSALRRFQAERKPALDHLLEIAERSAAWYERMREHMRLDPVPFVHSFLTRAGHIDLEKMRERDPDFVAAYEAYQAASGGALRSATPPRGRASP